jgi:hypothetical protein
VAALLPEPGDLAVCSMAGTPGRIIRYLQKLNGDGFRDYEHALVYLGGGKVLQAMPGGAQIADMPDPEHILWSTGCFPPLTGVQMALVPGIAAALKNTPYSALDYEALVAHRAHIPAPGLRAYIESTGHMICSQLADHVASLLGREVFTDLRWHGDVTPGDLSARFIELGARPLR